MQMIFSEVKQRSTVNADMLTLAYRLSIFFTQIAKEVNCVLAMVIPQSLVIRH